MRNLSLCVSFSLPGTAWRTCGGPDAVHPARRAGDAVAPTLGTCHAVRRAVVTIPASAPSLGFRGDDSSVERAEDGSNQRAVRLWSDLSDHRDLNDLALPSIGVERRHQQADIREHVTLQVRDVDRVDLCSGGVQRQAARAASERFCSGSGER